MKKRWLHPALWILALGCAALICFFSAQDGPASMDTSKGVVDWVLAIAVPNYADLPLQEQKEISQQYQWAIRKCAHFLEFALLGFLLRCALQYNVFRKKCLWAWLGGTFYAALDEGHQFLVGTRTAMWQDICLDSAGVFFGALLAAGIVTLWRRRKKAD